MQETKINNIRKCITNGEIQVVALALYLDVNDSTVSKWNSHVEEPSLKTLNEIGKVLEIDNRSLIMHTKRLKTGLAKALQKEYKHLLKVHETKVDSTDKEGNAIRVNNPDFVKALREFAEKYKSENNARSYPFYFDMPVAEVSEKDIQKTEYFICKADDASGELDFLVVSYKGKDKKPVARFNTLDDAQDYVDYREGF